MPLMKYILLTLLIAAFVTNAVLINVTVDDAGTDRLTGLGFSYSPLSDWNFGPNCTECVAQLNRSQLHMGSWHDATYDGSNGPRTELQSATLGFNGSAIYVYGVIVTSPLIPFGDTSSTHLGFFIDDQLVGTFNNTPAGNGSNPAAFKYNVTLYSNRSLPHGPHTFVLQNGLDGGPASIVLFDYLVYSTEQEDATVTTSAAAASLSMTSPTIPPPTSTERPASSSSALVKVLPATLGAIALIILLVLALLWRRRRRRRNWFRASRTPEVDLLSQPLSAANLRAHDSRGSVVVGARSRSGTTSSPETHSPLLHLARPGNPSSTSFITSSFLPNASSGGYLPDKLRMQAFPSNQSSHLTRNPSLTAHSDIAQTEYAESLPPPYSRGVDENI
ncbi:uncharacterized protein PHACADRAFT_203507 [Phanerochaete carnosa HHB-10118-sp]|uniref:Glycoside hydrolase family 16 protein n=1 Tax=Phanerochaete carnosa (strain HHB-10118-sp) TaxID=650164 RepID=K5XBC4_PHACS|nr:uncharacterized protein PHACADRAFT_203507 [Phanerochaete carnosa HHB-10118-sp]EKM60262.1 hypothetical protein PHACADRAFT_203507 [Phanerochaete carnosa HHB-10118-sp]